MERKTDSAMVDVSKVCYGVYVKGDIKVLLSDVSFHINAGELCALMGPSGAGKSTLLDLLAGRKMYGVWSGSILVNKRPRNQFFHRDSAYVLQDDLHLSTLTVEETLRYAAWVKLPEGTDKNTRSERVDFLLGMMGLAHVRHNFVGNAMQKGISGGQLKRLSIAVEIISLPSLIFFDEPTSGLDSAIALEVMTSVRKLVDQRRTCICTIHSPSPEVFGLFDSVILLDQGLLVYAGPRGNAVSYFCSGELGFQYDENSNPAEFILNVCASETAHNPSGRYAPSSSQLKKCYDKSPFRRVMLQNIENAEAEFAQSDRLETNPSISGHVRTHAVSNLTQMKMLFCRSFTAQIRDTAGLKTAAFKSLFVGIIIGIVFYKKASISPPFYTVDEQSGQSLLTSEVQNLASSFFFFIMYCLMSNLEQIPAICLGHDLYRRELASYCYSALPYWIVNCLYPLPLCIVAHSIWFVLSYYLCDYVQSWDYFLYFYWITFLTTVAAFYYAQGMAAATQSSEVSFALFPMTFVFLTQFTGYSIFIDNIPEGWIWASYISFPRWTFEGLMINEFGTRGEAGEEVLEQYGFNNFDKMYSIGIVLLAIVVCALMTYFFLRAPSSKLKHSSEMLFMAEPQSASSSDIKSEKDDSEDWIVVEDQDSAPLEEALDSRPLLSGIEEFNSLPVSQGCVLSFSRVEYRVDAKSAKGLLVLKGVSGAALPGEICALMGASGAGKTTLLDILSSRKTVGELRGHILFDGRKRDANIGRRCAYVMQDNVHLPMLTVRQTLRYASLLRMGQNVSNAAKHLRVESIIQVLGLKQHADTIVGNERTRGISGGQAKRLSIGVEMINVPDVIFLDEPTTGLDSSISLEVFKTVRILASQNRTVIATVHQPSTAVYEMFDKLLLLAEGQVIYYGKASAAVSFFTSSPYAFKYVRGSNPAEFVITVAGTLKSSSISTGNGDSVDEMVTYFQSSEFYQEMNAFVDCHNDVGEFEVVSSVQSYKYHTSTGHQIRVLFEREMLNKVKDPYSTIVDLLMHLLVSLFYGSVYHKLDNTQYQERLCVLFFSLIFMVMGHQKAIPVIFRQRLLFYRERSAGAYGPLAYWSTSLLTSLPFIVVNVFVYAITVHQLCGLRNNPGNFYDFYVTLFLMSVTGMFACQSIAAVAPSDQAAINIFPALIQFLMAFSGFGIFLPVMQTWIAVWAPFITFVRWGFQALMLNEFEGNNEMALSEVYIEDLGFDDYDKKTCMLIIPIFAAFYGFCQLAALKFITFEER